MQDEFETLENLYKLLRLEKSRQLVKEGRIYSTDEVRRYLMSRKETISKN